MTWFKYSNFSATITWLYNYYLWNKLNKASDLFVVLTSLLKGVEEQLQMNVILQPGRLIVSQWRWGTVLRKMT